MSTEGERELPLEIGHVLFVDIVGYSKLLINEQSDLVQRLKEMVRGCEQVRVADAEGKLIPLATGDGMALVFRNSPEAPVQCALELARADKQHPELKLRMGIHSGPINEVTDVNERVNVTGAGINLAQRVMDCGDAGHILLSQHVADDLEHYPRWRPLLHQLGECEVKHGVRLGLVNLYTDEVGNPAVPAKLRALKKRRARARWAAVTATIFLLTVIVTAIVIMSRPRVQIRLAAPEKSIAVLPFENLSQDKANAFFAEGIQGDVLTSLAKIHDLKVISRTSVMGYRDPATRDLRKIAKALGVSNILEGTVREAGGEVRVTVALVDVRSATQLWAESYDRELANVFSIQSDIAEQIVVQLQAQLLPGEKARIEKPDTLDLTAYQLYLRARALYVDTTNNLRAMEILPQIVRLLDEAVARDPHFLLAWCLLSKVHGEIYFFGHDHTPVRLELAKQAVDGALRFHPDAGEAHLALAYYYYHGFRDFGRAREELTIARRTLPNNAEVFEYTSYTACREGRWEEATQSMERAVELDPRNFLYFQQLALTYQPQRRYQEAARAWDRALEIQPGDFYTQLSRAEVALDWRADIKPYQTTIARLISENLSAARDLEDPFYSLCEGTNAAAERMLRNYPRDGVAYHGVNYPHAYWEGIVARWQGETAKAQDAFAAARGEVARIVERQPDFAQALSLLGMIDAGLGSKEEALREGRRACELLPISKDALSGTSLVANLAQICAWTGEKDLAIEKLVEAESVPNYLSYGFLKLQPQWDPLRGDPRFEKIVASLAPK